MSVCVCARVPTSVIWCTRVNIFLLCRLSASRHSWTTHEHICQCHEVEPFPARAGNFFHFPRVFLAPFFFFFFFFKFLPCFPRGAYENVQYLKITFSRGYYRGVGGGALIWMCLCFTEAGVGSLHALRSRPRSVPGVGPATRHGQLLWGSDRWDSHETKMEAGVMVAQENKKQECIMSELNM